MRACPNCLVKLGANEVVCTACGVDTQLYAGLVRVSDRLYNRGLARLRAADLTQGIQLLTKAVAVNKNNAPARNLLGLAMFESGRVADALTQWILSAEVQKADNPAVTYIEQTQRNTRGLEKMDDAAGMFNQALSHLKNKNDDLAIIELKNALELHPKFTDALNLLTLCYMIQGDREKAAPLPERVLAIDAGNTIALGYYQILHPPRARTVLQMVQRTAPVPLPAAPLNGNTGPYKPVNIQEKKPTNFHIAEILTFIIGVVVASAVMYFLIYPGIVGRHDTSMEALRGEMRDAAEAAETAQSALHATITDRDDEITALQESHAETYELLQMQARMNDVHIAYRRFQTGELQEAVDLLDTIDLTGMRFDIERIARDIIMAAYPVLGAEHFAAGQAAMNDNDFSLARGHLQSAYRFLTPLEYGDPLPTQWNELVFLLGQMHFTFYEFDAAEQFLQYFLALVPSPPAARYTIVNEMLDTIEAGR
jgi:tetratricopeptide (TPR) repeat protein